MAGDIVPLTVDADSAPPPPPPCRPCDPRLELVVAKELLEVGLELRKRAAALVLVLPLSVLVEEESGIALHLLVDADLLVLRRRAINLGNFHVGLRLLRFSGQLLPGGLQFLAVAAPRGIELDEGDALGDRLVELLLAAHRLDDRLLLVLDSGLRDGILVLRWLALARHTHHFLHVALQGGQVARSGVLFDLLAVLDPQQRGIALHLKVLANGPELGAVYLGDGDGGLRHKFLGQLLPCGSQALWTRITEG